MVILVINGFNLFACLFESSASAWRISAWLLIWVTNCCFNGKNQPLPWICFRISTAARSNGVRYFRQKFFDFLPISLHFATLIQPGGRILLGFYRHFIANKRFNCRFISANTENIWCCSLICRITIWNRCIIFRPQLHRTSVAEVNLIRQSSPNNIVFGWNCDQLQSRACPMLGNLRSACQDNQVRRIIPTFWI